MYPTANERPDAAEGAYPSPRGVGSYQLSPEHTRTERQDGEDQDRHILAPLRSRSKFTCGSQSSELVDTSTYTCEDHAADEHIHAVSSGADDHSHHYEGCADDGDVSSTEDIAERADEGTNCS